MEDMGCAWGGWRPEEAVTAQEAEGGERGGQAAAAGHPVEEPASPSASRDALGMGPPPERQDRLKSKYVFAFKAKTLFSPYNSGPCMPCRISMRLALRLLTSAAY